MLSFFKTLRRKLGVVTLVLGCVFAAGWLRDIKGVGPQISIQVQIGISRCHYGGSTISLDRRLSSSMEHR